MQSMVVLWMSSLQQMRAIAPDVSNAVRAVMWSFYSGLCSPPPPLVCVCVMW